VGIALKGKTDDMIPTLTKFLREVAQQIPPVRYAFGAAGIAGAEGLPTLFLGYGRPAIIVWASTFIAMGLLLVFASVATSRDRALRQPHWPPIRGAYQRNCPSKDKVAQRVDDAAKLDRRRRSRRHSASRGSREDLGNLKASRLSTLRLWCRTSSAGRNHHARSHAPLCGRLVPASRG
jgi:hypothetical protein